MRTNILWLLLYISLRIPDDGTMVMLFCSIRFSGQYGVARAPEDVHIFTVACRSQSGIVEGLPYSL